MGLDSGRQFLNYFSAILLKVGFGKEVIIDKRNGLKEIDVFRWILLRFILEFLIILTWAGERTIFIIFDFMSIMNDFIVTVEQASIELVSDGEEFQFVETDRIWI